MCYYESTTHQQVPYRCVSMNPPPINSCPTGVLLWIHHPSTGALQVCYYESTTYQQVPYRCVIMNPPPINSCPTGVLLWIHHPPTGAKELSSPVVLAVRLSVNPFYHIYISWINRSIVIKVKTAVNIGITSVQCACMTAVLSGFKYLRRNMNQNLYKYFIQLCYKIIRFSRTQVWNIKFTETFSSEGILIDWVRLNVPPNTL